MPANGAIEPGPSTTRLASRGRAAARERWLERASRWGLDDTGKVAEQATAIPPDVRVAGWYVVITGVATSPLGGDAAISRFDYTVDVYASVSSTTVVAGLTGARARNVCEVDNTGTRRAGYTITAGGSTCGAKVGIRPIGTGLRVAVVDFDRLPGTEHYRFFFQLRNDPIYYGVAE